MEESVWRSVLSVASDGATVTATGWALWLYFANRERISSALDTLLQYNRRREAADLHGRIERLSYLRVTDTKEREEILNLLADVVGQLTDSPARGIFEPVLRDARRALGEPAALTEPDKRILTSRLRTLLRQYEFELEAKEGKANE